MTINDVLSTLKNGATRLIIYDNNSGEVVFKTIWHNLVPCELLNKEIICMRVLDYELRIGVNL